MSDAFISYSRRDGDFARQLVAALEAHGKTGWLDVEDIPPASRWDGELKHAIEGADAFVFVMSPDSIQSVECRKELEHAVALNKRIIPVHYRQVDPASVDPELAVRNWIPQVGLFADNFDNDVTTLVTAIETDLEWVHQHTVWLGKSLDWEGRNEDASLLLRGSELDAAEQWLQEQTGKSPAPTELQQRFIFTSRRASVRRLRRTRTAIASALVVTLVLAAIALVQRNTAINNEHTATARLLLAQSETALGANPELSAAYAMQSLRTKSTSQGEAALRNAAPRMAAIHTLNVGGRVNDAEYNPAGSLIVTASSDGFARLWDAHTGAHVADLHDSNAGGLNSAVFDHSGNRIVTGGQNGIATIWDVNSRTIARALKEPAKASITRATFNPKGTDVLTASADGFATVWNSSNGTVVARLNNHARLEDAEFSPNGRDVATAGDRGTGVGIWVFDSPSKPRRVETIAAGGSEQNTIVLSVRYSNDGMRIVTAEDSGVQVWLSLVGTADGPAFTNPKSEGFASAAFSPDGNSVVAASADGLARVWNPRIDETLNVLTGHEAVVESAVFSPDGTNVLTASADGTVRTWDAKPPELVALMPTAASAPVASTNGIAFAPGGAYVAVASDFGVELWDSHGSMPPTFLNAVGDSESVAFSPDGHTLVAGSADGSVQLLSVTNTTQPATTLLPATPTGFPIARVAFNPSGTEIATAGLDGTVHLIDLATNTTRRVLITPSKQRFYDAQFSADGKQLVTADAGGRARIWDVTTGKQVGELDEPNLFPLRAASFSPDGSRVLTASVDGSARVWDVATKQAKTVITEPNGSPFYGAEFDPAGRRIVTASVDGTTRIWDANTGSQLEDLEVLDTVNTTQVLQAAFSPDGTQVVSTATDNTQPGQIAGLVRVWSTELAVPISGVEAIASRRLEPQFVAAAKSKS